MAQSATTEILVRSENFNEDAWQTEPIYFYDSLNLPKNLTRSFLQMSLQTFYNQLHGIAFRRIGDWRDFDHGHLLTDGRNLRALLFHTQERASMAQPGSPYGYLNKDLRNWLIFMESPSQILDATEFKYPRKPSFWSGPKYERNVTWEQYENQGTVVELMLDPEKMGFQIASFLDSEKTESFSFKRTKCPKTIHPQSNIVSIMTKEGPICLYVTTMACIFKSHFKCPGKLSPY